MPSEPRARLRHPFPTRARRAPEILLILAAFGALLLADFILRAGLSGP